MTHFLNQLEPYTVLYLSKNIEPKLLYFEKLETSRLNLNSLEDYLQKKRIWCESTPLATGLRVGTMINIRKQEEQSQIQISNSNKQ